MAGEIQATSGNKPGLMGETGETVPSFSHFLMEFQVLVLFSAYLFYFSLSLCSHISRRGLNMTFAV